MRTSLMSIALVLALGLLGPPLGAHVAPAVDANNRYLRLSPMRDRVRLAYTVYIGEIPGSQARRRMDRNHNGVVDDSEADAYGQELAESVARGLELQWDGQPYELSWAEMHVGMGMPTVDAGSFSVDLIAWICGRDQTTHDLVFFDHFRIPLPGETEIRLQQSPGIEIKRSTLGEDGRHSQLDFKWRGADGPMSKLGYYLRYQVAPDSAQLADRDQCRENASEPAGGGRNWRAAVAIAAAALVAFALLVLWQRRRERAAKQRHIARETQARQGGREEPAERT